MSDEVSARVAQLQRVAERFRDDARAYAEKVRALVELERLFGDDRDGLVLELSGTARMGQDRTAGELDRARRLHQHYPRALTLLGRGEMLVATVDILLRLTTKCSEQVQDELGRRLPDNIAHLDAADARPLIATTILQVETELELAAQQDRYAKARANRGVWVMQVEDGMARVGAEVDALIARRFSLDLDELVGMEKVRDTRDGAVRTQAQRRADVLAELPARHLALLQVLARGQASQLLAEVQARTGAGTAKPPREEELPLGLPPAEREPCWALDPFELGVELLRQPVRNPTVMNVHVQMSTALDVEQQPAVVEGFGPVPGWLARTLLPDAALRRVAVNAATGIPLYLDPVIKHRPQPPPPDDPQGPGPDPGGPGDASPDGPPGQGLRAAPPRASNDQVQQQLLAMLRPLLLPDTTEPQHDPSTWLRRLVQARDLRCTGPGCPRWAHSCDLDHEDDYASGGPTSEPNLSAKTPRCHRAKHAGWTVVRDRLTGVTTWTSPNGSVFSRQPRLAPPSEAPRGPAPAPAAHPAAPRCRERLPDRSSAVDAAVRHRPGQAHVESEAEAEAEAEVTVPPLARRRPRSLLTSETDPYNDGERPFSSVAVTR